MNSINPYNQIASSANYTSGTSGYYPPQQTYQQQYVPPPIWHTFHPCGHQIKLEQGQPAPIRCQVCPAPEHAHHEYKKCGHVHNYEKGQAIPPECPTCVNQKWQAEAEAKKRVEEAEAEEQRRALEDKDPLAWLDKEVTSVREVAFA